MSLYAEELRFPFTGTKGLSTLPALMHSANCSVPQIHPLDWQMVVSFTPLQPMLGIAHGDLRLVWCCSSMETYSMKLPTSSYCADVALRGSLELGSECCNQWQTIFTRYVI
jgi:hypothetical protein